MENQDLPRPGDRVTIYFPGSMGIVGTVRQVSETAIHMTDSSGYPVVIDRTVITAWADVRRKE